MFTPVSDFLAVTGCFPGIGSLVGLVGCVGAGGTATTYICRSGHDPDFSTEKTASLIKKRKDLMLFNFIVTNKAHDLSKPVQMSMTVYELKARVERDIENAKSFLKKSQEKEVIGLQSVKSDPLDEGTLNIIRSDLQRTENEFIRIQRQVVHEVKRLSQDFINEKVVPQIKENIKKLETIAEILVEKEREIEELKKKDTSKTIDTQLHYRISERIGKLDAEIKRREEKQALKFHALFGLARITFFGGVPVCIYYFHQKKKHLAAAIKEKKRTELTEEEIQEIRKEIGPSKVEAILDL